jgi:RHS repeat-associated protein
LIIEYKYNDSGYRTEKKVTKNSQVVTTNYFLDGDKVLKETRSDGVSIDYFYDVDGKATGFSYDDNIYLYLYNLQGDITKIVDESRNVVVEYSYDAWGNIIDQTDNELAKINPFRYRGYRYDEETNLYYLNSRYYNPEVGRFINADGLIGQTGEILSHNMYAYTGNNPVMYYDPNGYFLEKIIDYVIDNLKIKSKKVFTFLDESHGITKQRNGSNVKSTAFFSTLEILNISSTSMTLFNIGGGLNRTEHNGKYSDQWVELVSGNVFAEADIKDKVGVGIFGSLVSGGINGSIPIPFTNTNFVLGVNGHIGAAGVEAKIEDSKIKVKLAAVIGLGFEIGFE